MSKKNKKKINLQELLVQVEKEEKQSKQNTASEKIKKVASDNDDDRELDGFVKQDIKKISFALLICFIVIGVFWYLDAKTLVVGNISQNISSLFRIGF